MAAVISLGAIGSPSAARSAISRGALKVAPLAGGSGEVPPTEQVPQGEATWPSFRNGSARTGYQPSEFSIGRSNVGALAVEWSATTDYGLDSPPAIANGVAYVPAGEDAKDTLLYAFDAAGSSNCAGSPKTCAPLWTATAGLSGRGPVSSPAVANGVVYVSGFYDNKLYAFDAGGLTNCSGSPKICEPLWSATIGPHGSSSPAIANGVVYIGTTRGKLYAFDAAGSIGCSGSPKTCAPLWTAATAGFVDSSPAVDNGVVYLGSSDNKLYAFDAAGSIGCSGSPKTCAPLWTAATAGSVYSSPAVANGVVYVGVVSGRLYAFDAAASSNCSGIPKTCAPLWTATTHGYIDTAPAVGNGVVYLAVANLENNLWAFDAAGSSNCSGSPKTCAPMWTAKIGDCYSSPALANGVVYVGSADIGANGFCDFNRLRAFDAAGSTNCAGRRKTCAPLWTATTNDWCSSEPVVANGVVYVGSCYGTLYAFGLQQAIDAVTYNVANGCRNSDGSTKGPPCDGSSGQHDIIDDVNSGSSKADIYLLQELCNAHMGELRTVLGASYWSKFGSADDSACPQKSLNKFGNAIFVNNGGSLNRSQVRYKRYDVTDSSGYRNYVCAHTTVRTSAVLACTTQLAHGVSVAALESQELLTWLNANAHPNETVIVGGDFNLTPTDGDGTWYSAWLNAGFINADPSQMVTDSHGKEIDYVWVKPVQPGAAQLIYGQHSDHQAVRVLVPEAPST